MSRVISIVEDRAHAKLSASGSGKWLVCTPSAHLEEQFPDEASEFASEGTFAHEVFEHLLGARLGRHVADIRQFREDKHWSADLLDHVQSAVEVAWSHIQEIQRDCPDALVLLEQRLDFSPWVPSGFGTGDVVIVADGVLSVMDLKFGKGYEVTADGNTQMALYALGAYNQHAHLYEFDRVRMTILQPRLNNYAAAEMRVDDLLEWAENHVKPRATLAWDGHGEFVAGDHCSSYFCRARFTCAARAAHAMTLAQSDFALRPPELLTEEQILQVLARGDAVAKWISDVQGYALEQAEKHGRQWAGHKLVEGRSNRKLTDPDQVAERLIAAGFDETVLYERSLLTLTALEKLVGPKKFAEIAGDLVNKPHGKPALVPVSDKRPALSSVASAQEDFQ